MTMKHIVALSGGKDSTVMALRLAEVEPSDYEYVITPTGDELPEMYEHWKRLGALLGKPLKPITSGYSLQGLIRKWNALPNWRQRWCTRVLKIEPFNAYLMANLPATTYVGLRADEPEDIRRGTILGGVEGITQRYPLREWGWGIDEVRGYLTDLGITIPQRTDCARCFSRGQGNGTNCGASILTFMKKQLPTKNAQDTRFVSRAAIKIGTLLGWQTSGVLSSETTSPVVLGKSPYSAITVRICAVCAVYDGQYLGPYRHGGKAL